MLVTPVSVSLPILWMNLRSKPRLDYLALHRTGAKVIKMDENGDNVQAPNINVVTSLKILEDLEFNLDLFEDIEDYEFKSEVKEALTSVSALLQAYRQVNVDYKVEVGC